MTRLRNYTFLVLSLLFFLGGCTIFPKRTAAPSVVDPLIERNRQWREHVEAGNYELKRGNLRAALTAYEGCCYDPFRMPMTCSTKLRRYIFNLRNTKTQEMPFSYFSR